MYQFIIILFIILLLYVLLNNYNTNHNNHNNHSTDFLDVIQKISSGDKVYLTNIKEKWMVQKNVMDQNLQQQIISIIQTILSSIYRQSNIQLFVKNIDKAYVMKDNDNNVRCITECFVYDVDNYHTVKMIFDFVIFESVTYINFVDVDETALNNILNRYDIRWRSQGILSKYNMFDENVYKLLDNHYLNHYTILPLKKGPYNMDTSGTFTLDQLSHMYLPANIPSVNSPDFCQKETFSWDSKSIPISTNENCTFNNPPDTQYPNQPTQTPGVVIRADNLNPFSWLTNPSISNSL